ncbi:4-azaleucine resistance transporter AzlC [Haloactinopolyspora alba]|uniref:4-azaleucine resistance transporter AzlC n=1 Tax=Haloactinopolyspora alba TaxID=648780 RepID=A0A2P8E5N6_9ACTN|nr:AzlC family ABC transporter permease [Haloactinopolyspora alba]PSL04779.1 4-azaleucine resistance transporter AzlC [Haloactinopolyspora alba]
MRSVWRTLGAARIRDIAAVGASVCMIGISYGVTAHDAGFALWQIIALAVLVLGASSELLFVGVLAAGGAPALAVLAGLVVNARNAAYGMRAGAFLHGRRTRLAGAHLVNDESVALATAAPTPETARATFWASGVTIMVSWPLGAFVGATLGQVVHEPAVLGLDAVFPAVLLALVLPALRRDTTTRVCALAGGCLAVAGAPVLPAGVAPLVALLAVLVSIPSTMRSRR